MTSDLWFTVIPAFGVAVLILARPFIGLLLFTFLIPLESAFLSINDGAASLIRYLGILIFGAWLISALLEHRKPNYQPGLKWALLLIVWGGVSYLWAWNKDAVIARTLTGFQLVLLVIVVIDQVNSLRRLKAILTALFLGCFLVTILGYLGIGVQSNSLLLTLQNQGAKEYGCYVGVLFLMGSALLFLESGRNRWLGLMSVGISIIPLIRISERGVLLAIGLAWVALAVVGRQKLRDILVIVFLTFFIYFIPPVMQQSGLISDRIAERLTVQHVIETGGTGRDDIWAVGWNMFVNNVFIGTGAGNFPFVFLQYDDVVLTNFRFGNDPHSDFFGIAGELGLVGLFLFIGILLGVGFRLKYLLDMCPDVGRNILFIFVFALFIYIFSLGITSTFLWRKIYWLILALAMLAPGLWMHQKPIASENRWDLARKIKQNQIKQNRGLL
jgi:O-antigen ligase